MPPLDSQDVGDATATLAAEAAAGDAATEAAAAKLQDDILEAKDATAEANMAGKEGVDASKEVTAIVEKKPVRKINEPSLSRGSSCTSLSSTTRKARYPSAKKSPLAVPPPFDPPVVDQFGFPCAQRSSILDEDNWDTRHHLNGNENELKPKGMRDYFSSYALEGKALKRELKYNPGTSSAPTSQSLLKSMSLPEVNDRKPSPVCPDAGPPLVPGRHYFGGSMKDRDGQVRLWNDRWHKSIGALNENCHPDHRTYFTQNSLFEESPSQSWRRYLDQEIAHGVWKPIACKKPHKFPPLGGRLRGRSGVPIPGASP